MTTTTTTTIIIKNKIIIIMTVYMVPYCGNTATRASHKQITNSLPLKIDHAPLEKQLRCCCYLTLCLFPLQNLFVLYDDILPVIWNCDVLRWMTDSGYCYPDGPNRKKKTFKTINYANIVSLVFEWIPSIACQKYWGGAQKYWGGSRGSGQLALTDDVMQASDFT